MSKQFVDKIIAQIIAQGRTPKVYEKARARSDLLNTHIVDIYKSSLTVNSINTIFSNDTYNFAGRPPLVMNFSFNNEDAMILKMPFDI